MALNEMEFAMFKKYRHSQVYEEALMKAETALIVEDQAVDIIAHYTLSSHLGLDVTLAFDGAQALELLKKMNFDYFIIDWNMPHMSGSELLFHMESFVQSRPNRKRPKIIIYSGNKLSFEFLSQFETLNIVDIWKKPMLPSEMLRRLKLISKGA